MLAHLYFSGPSAKAQNTLIQYRMQQLMNSCRSKFLLHKVYEEFVLSLLLLRSKQILEDPHIQPLHNLKGLLNVARLNFQLTNSSNEE